MTVTTKTVIVDDHDVVRTGLASTIEHFDGIDVVGMAASETEAKEVFASLETIDLLIIDIALEDTNTFNLVRNVKKQFKNLKVIFISGFTEEEFHQRMFEAGGDAFWCKLEPLDKLWDLIKNTAKENDPQANGIKADSSSRAKPILSNREEQVIACIARGMTVKQIAEKYELSSKTVEAHKSNLMMKLCVHSQVDLVRWAIKNGVVTP
ncbi:response regulator transcription factor [bacterium]|nr:response regulator transcription factor [bacterium]